MSSIYKNIFHELENIPIVDTHEHILEYPAARSERLGALETFSRSYVMLDFISAGMDPRVWQSADDALRWRAFEKYQPHVRNTNFYKCAIRALQDLYGLEADELNRENALPVNRRIEAAYADEKWYTTVLKQRCNFAISILDNYWSVETFSHDQRLFAPALRADPFILGRCYRSPYVAAQNSHSTVEDIAGAWNMPLDSLEQYLAVIDAAFERYIAKGCPAVKICAAYERDLHFAACDKTQAERLYREPADRLSPEARSTLGNYMAHYIIRTAGTHGLPVQIHTGFLARNANLVNNGNPEHLNPLFMTYPGVDFVLFHNGYPFTDTTFSMVKMFPNLYLDICWTSCLSSRLAEKSLSLALDLIPCNKIMWGGDAERVEDAYSSTRLSLEVIARVLAKKIKSGMSGTYALRVAHDILHQNALHLYPNLADRACRTN